MTGFELSQRAIAPYIAAVKRGELTPEDEAMVAKYEAAKAALLDALRGLGG